MQLHCGDASEYIRRQEVRGAFDVILVDSSDPGPFTPCDGESIVSFSSNRLRLPS